MGSLTGSKKVTNVLSRYLNSNHVVWEINISNTIPNSLEQKKADGSRRYLEGGTRRKNHRNKDEGFFSRVAIGRIITCQFPRVYRQTRAIETPDVFLISMCSNVAEFRDRSLQVASFHFPLSPSLMILTRCDPQLKAFLQHHHQNLRRPAHLHVHQFVTVRSSQCECWASTKEDLNNSSCVRVLSAHHSSKSLLYIESEHVFCT